MQSEYTINDMLVELAQFKKRHGNLPVAFWEGRAVEMRLTPSRDGVRTNQGSGRGYGVFEERAEHLEEEKTNA